MSKTNQIAHYNLITKNDSHHFVWQTKLPSRYIDSRRGDRRQWKEEWVLGGTHQVGNANVRVLWVSFIWHASPLTDELQTSSHSPFPASSFSFSLGYGFVFGFRTNTTRKNTAKKISVITIFYETLLRSPLTLIYEC